MSKNSSNSNFVYSDGLGEPGTIAAVTTAFATLYPVIFGGGDPNKERRKQKRQALANVGFRWDRTKGSNPADYDNIDGWPDVSLDNIAKAYQQYGQIVPQLHNQGVFNKANTQSYQQIVQIIEQNGGSSGGWGNQGSITQSGFNAFPWLLGAGAVIVGGAVYKKSQEKS